MNNMKSVGQSKPFQCGRYLSLNVAGKVLVYPRGDIAPVHMGRLPLRSLLGLSKRRATEGTRIEAALVSSLRSPLAAERRRMERRILRRGAQDPYEMVAVLLKYYNHPDKRVRGSVRSSLKEIASSRAGQNAVLNNTVHPSRDVRRAVLAFLGENVGFHAITYASFYEQTMLLTAMARNRNIPVDDIEALADLSKNTFLEGEIMEAVKDISSCLDFVKHRYKNAEQLRNYVVDILRMAPDLTKIGVFGGPIEEPLRKAIRASRSRTYDETREIIEERMKESGVRNELIRIGKIVKETVKERPEMGPSDLSGVDVWVVSRLHELMDGVTSATLSGKKDEGIEQLRSFLEDEFADFYEENCKDRIAAGDRSAAFTVYTIGLVCLKLASGLLPSSSEEIYQRYFRELEEELSIHLVMWPEIVMRIIG